MEGTHSLGRLIERNGPDVELLDLIDGADGQSAVVGQSQTETEGRANQSQLHLSLIRGQDPVARDRALSYNVKGTLSETWVARKTLRVNLKEP